MRERSSIRLEREPRVGVDPRQVYRSAHEQMQRDRLRLELRHIKAFERKFGRAKFVTGEGLDLKAISPQLRVADLRGDSEDAESDRAIVNYMRRYQTVSSRMSVGRENAYILEDAGQKSRPVMGVLVLASARYFQPRRDEVLGWLLPHQLNAMSTRVQAEHKAIRHAGLRRMMHVAICCAIPPYSILGAARLLALAPFTESVLVDFTARWKGDSDLAMVTTTCSMGQTGTPFQRMISSRFFDTASAALGTPWNREGRVYCRLGDIHPWRPDIPVVAPEAFANFEGLVSPRTRRLAKQFAVAAGITNASPQKVLDFGLQRLGLNWEIFRGNPIGVFIGAVDRPSIEAIATGVPRASRPRLSWDLVVQKFRSDFGEEPDLTKMKETERTARKEAITRRRARALAVTLEDIKLSSRLDAARVERSDDEA
jgi:hypothetical protein